MKLILTCSQQKTEEVVSKSRVDGGAGAKDRGQEWTDGKYRVEERQRDREGRCRAIII